MSRLDWNGRSAAIMAAFVMGTPVAAFLTFAHPALILGLVAVGIAVRWPTALVCALVITCQEIRSATSFAHARSLLTFGNEVYFTTIARLSVIEIVVFAAALGAMLYANRVWLPAKPIAIVGLLVMLIAFSQGDALSSAVIHEGRNYLLAIAAVMIASTTHLQRGGWPLVIRVCALTISGLAIAGVVFYLSGSRAQDATGRLTLFYDSALPALAGAVLICWLTSPKIRGHLLVTFASVIAPTTIVLLSGRRNVWIATAIALAILMLVRTDVRRVVRAAGVVSIGAFVVGYLAPSLVTSVSTQLGEVNASIQGHTTDSSTAGHIDDLHVGVQLAKASPFWGYGYDSRPLPGLYVQTGELYVHNDVLQQWLRFGPIVGLCTIALMLGGVVLALRRARSSPPVQSRIGAALLLIWPACGMTAPFASTTMRWPILLGLSIGAILEGRTDGQSQLAAPIESSRTEDAGENKELDVMA